MSKPTNILLVHAADDDGTDRLTGSIVDAVGIHGRLMRVDSVAAEWDAGTAVHIGSFNHLDEPLFLRLAREANWRQPDRLQVFIGREDDAVS